MDKLKISHINLHHSRTASAEICQLFTMGHTKISLIQEPWVNNNRVLGLNPSGGNIYCGTTTCNPRVCIITDKNINANLLPQCSSRDCVAILVKFKVNEIEEELVFASVYLPYNSPTPPPSQDMTNLIDFCNSRNLSLILGCDANSHHVLWGSSDINNRGRHLVEYLASSNLEILNQGNIPTFSNGRRNEVIDITLATQSFLTKVLNWRVTNAILTSDHRCIQFDLAIDPVLPTPFRNRKITDWDKYSLSLNGAVSLIQIELGTVDGIDRMADMLHKAVINAFEEACPLRIPRKSRNPPWWNTDLKALRKDVRKKLNKANNSGRSEDRELYKASQKNYKAALRLAQRTSWRDYCCSVEKIPAISRLNKCLSKTPQCKLGFLQLPSGDFTKSEEETARHLLEIHFPGCREVGSPEEQNVDSGNPSQDDWDHAYKVIDLNKVEWSIRTFSPYKAAGPDGIFPALLQKGLPHLLTPLCQLLTASLAFGYIPKAWRSVKVVFLPKPGKSNYNLAKSYRPISLSSFFLKTHERLVDRFIRDTSLKQFPLHPNQHAFQSNKSTETALHHLIGKIEKALDLKQFAFATFLDIEGAFDNTAFESIRLASQNHQVPELLIKWIQSMLKCRRVQIQVGNHTIVVSVDRGCPQGGVLSPLLWSMVVNSIIVQLNEEGFFTISYADDIVIIIIGKYENILCDLMQRALKLVERWCRDRNLSVNPCKTESVLFTLKTKLPNMTIPRIFNRELQLVDRVKYLGVILDKKLNWSAHVENKLHKACISFWQCRRVIGNTWGLSPRVIHWLYTAIIRPCLSYASVVWWPRANKVTVKKELDHLQRMACISITGAMRTTPTAAIEIILNLLPLDRFIKSTAEKAAYRLSCHGEWDETGKVIGHRDILKLLREQCPTINMHTDSISPRYAFDQPYKVVFPTREEWSVSPCQFSPVNDENWYTDGSYMNDKAGAGAHLDGSNIEVILPLGCFTTVFQAEATAIIACVDTINISNSVNRNINIFTDSQAVLKALSSPMINSNIIWECKQKLRLLAQEKNITLIWVPGHSNISGNEKADELARRGSALDFIGPEPAVGVSRAKIMSDLESRNTDKHKKIWQDMPSCRQAKELIDIPNKNSKKILLDLKREDLRLLVGVLTGHASLNKHLTTIGVKNNPVCEKCNLYEETAKHFLCECPAFNTLRLNLFGAYTISTEIAKNANLRVIMKFISDTRRFVR